MSKDIILEADIKIRDLNLELKELQEQYDLKKEKFGSIDPSRIITELNEKIKYQEELICKDTGKTIRKLLRLLQAQMYFSLKSNSLKNIHIEINIMLNEGLIGIEEHNVLYIYIKGTTDKMELLFHSETAKDISDYLISYINNQIQKVENNYIGLPKMKNPPEPPPIRRVKISKTPNVSKEITDKNIRLNKAKTWLNKYIPSGYWKVTDKEVKSLSRILK